MLRWLVLCVVVVGVVYCGDCVVVCCGVVV